MLTIASRTANERSIGPGGGLLPASIVAKVEPDPRTGCWRWTASTRRDGYGQVWRRLEDGSRRLVYAHRFVYELLVGPVPARLELDHRCHDPEVCRVVLCEHRRCVNPWHVEPVTHATNVARGGLAAANRRRAEAA